MSEALELACYGLAYLMLLTAVGAGMVSLTGWTGHRLLLAPIVGIALASAVLTTAAAVMPMRTAAFMVLLPIAITSILVAFRRRKSWRVGKREAALAMAAVVVAYSIAALPGLVRGSAGPLGLGVWDSLVYVQLEEQLQDHKIGDRAPEHNLTARYGMATWNSHYRLGASALNAAAASLFGTTPDKTALAELAAVFALLPLCLYAVARSMGESRAVAAFAGSFSLSPGLLMLVFDGQTPNLTAIVLTPAILLTAGLAIYRRSDADLCMSAVLLGGLICIYPEFVPSTIAIGVLGVLVTLYIRRANLVQELGIISRRMLVLITLTLAIAPVGIYRATQLLTLYGNFVSDQPGRGLTFANAWSWAFGTLHLYELPRFSLLSNLKLVFAIGVAGLLALLMFLGIRRTSIQCRTFIVAPILLSIGIGLWVWSRYQHGECEYCLWKALTLTLPFLALGTALGFGVLLYGVRFRQIRLIGAATIAFLAAVGIARTNVELIEAAIYSEARVRPATRALQTLGSRVPDDRPILIEGADATVVGRWSVATDYLFLSRTRQPLVLAALGGSAQFLGVPKDAGAQYYDPSYEYVVSRFGIESERKIIASVGPYTLSQRAPIDVSFAGTGWAYDPKESPRATLWVIKPFQLWISSPHYRGPIALLVTRTLPLRRQATLWFNPGQATVVVEDGQKFCVHINIRKSLTIVAVKPIFDVMPRMVRRATESDPIPPPPKVLGLKEISARPGVCAAH